jgi:hypothetical protein
MLPCARLCFLSAPFYASSHTTSAIAASTNNATIGQAKTPHVALQGPGADRIGKDMLGNVLIVPCKRYAPRTTVGSPQIRECLGAHENVAARELIFVTTSTFTSEAIHAGEIGHSRGWLTMIDGSRLLTIVIACWERLPGHWQARFVGQEQS